MANDGEYRGIKYSLSQSADGKWKWKLHPKLIADAVSAIISGSNHATEAEAIAALQKAINELAASNR